MVVYDLDLFIPRVAKCVTCQIISVFQAEDACSLEVGTPGSQVRYVIPVPGQKTSCFRSVRLSDSVSRPRLVISCHNDLPGDWSTKIVMGPAGIEPASPVCAGRTRMR
jgi:hypothetical protein